ncbi:LysM peptidoglycan-binding domain-containing protein [Archangium minus]|uniref:LysM peptidoglycan-binding domain-containing protein n=1 Tax=Archangium minus TaxID=83450 RepID=A0ABY9WPU9_9BACT|nr:LysM peptidoglycan-binding domain-containing protein [Archangium minus]
MLRSSSVRGLATVLALVCCLPAQSWAQQVVDDDVYVVQPGDTCGSVARKVFGDVTVGSAKLHALNKMGPPPHELKPGTVLRIKGDPDARLTFIRPEVNAKRAGKVEWRQANTGQGLWRLDSVNTLREAGAEVTFKDLTRLQMNENALVVIYGQAPKASDAVKKSGAVELLQGELNVSLAELRGEPVGVQMPAASVAARSKELLVGVDAQQTSRVSVYDGQAEVHAKGQSVQVPRDHGTRVEKGKVPEKPRPLPEAPAWAGLVRPVRMLLDDKGVDEELTWAPVKEAASYRVELARDERFNDRVHGETVPAGQESLKSVARALAPGRYFARVRAVDASGLVGRASPVRQVEVLRVKTERGVAGPQGLRGAFRLDLSVEGAESLDFRLDGAPTTHPVRVEAVGSHTLEVLPRGVPDARPETLTLTVVPPRVDVDLEPVASSFRVKVQVRDEQGRPLEGPFAALKLRGLHGTQVEEPLRRQSDGSLVTRAVPGMRNGERVASVEALWGDTRVQQVNAQAPLAQDPVVSVAEEPEPPVASAEEEAALMSMLGAPSGGLVEAAPMPTAFLPRAWLFELRAQPELGSAGVDLARGRTTLAVEGRVSERVALGTALAMRPGVLLRGDGASGELPATALSASLSARVRLTDHPAFRVLLSFDGTLAGSEFDEEARGLRLRPALLVGMRRGQWAFSTSQGYGLRPGEARASWDSAYQAWFLPLPTLALGAEIDALVDATPREPGPFACAAGVGARFMLAGFELGTSVRRGFGPDGARVWGGWSGQVTLGWSGLLPAQRQ